MIDMILQIETSDKYCSVALSHEGEVIDELIDKGERTHASALTVLIGDLLSGQKMKLPGIDAVAVSKGPGSYTGLRIGVSVAKGICYGTGIPLLGIPTLQAMASGYLGKNQIVPSRNTLICPMLDARRMEVYCAFFDESGNYIEKEQAVIIEENSFRNFKPEDNILFLGPGSDKCREVISRDNISFVENIYPLASSMTALAEDYYRKGMTENVAYFEPFYLKDFIATKPTGKIFE